MINRRLFLEICSAVGLLACDLRGDARAAASLNRPSLGFSLYGMKSVPLDQALQVCSSIGYSHVELALNEGYPTQPDRLTEAERKSLVKQLSELNLHCPCLMVNFNLTADDKAQQSYIQSIEQAAALARTLNQSKPPILETVLGGNPAGWDKQKSLMVDNLRSWAEKARDAECEIAIKAHIRSAVNSPERLLWLVEQVALKSIVLAYDFSHFELQGIGLRESMSAIVPKARFIHVKDTVGNADKFEFLLPGSGRTDYQQYFSLLREFSYVGPVCVEVSSQVFNKPGYDPIQAAQSSFDALQPALLQAFSS